jgi:hypothetical protein
MTEVRQLLPALILDWASAGAPPKKLSVNNNKMRVKQRWYSGRKLFLGTLFISSNLYLPMA